ncbi:MAG: hypothetical protein E6F95_09800 [Actinobacteria bacterium]|nr:MAG: hypothetical protein E6F95_09800 [Actinomycetota bacterium]
MRRRSSTGILVLFLLAAACTSTSTTKVIQTSPSSTSASLLNTDGYALLCGGASCDVPSGGVPGMLWRPLSLPTLGTGETCPVAAPHRVSRRYGPAVGDGPVLAVGLASKTVLPFEYPPSKRSIFYGSKWGGSKVLWIGDPSYAGPVLIRGAQLDGRHLVGFSVGDGSTAYNNLQFPPGRAPEGNDGWREWPSETRLQASGCYAYQVDGTSFSEVIVFRAVATHP